MAFERAKTSLAEIENKLRKALGLAGPIGASLDPTLSPTFITGDSRDPGIATFRGRKWAWVSEPVSGPYAIGDVVGLTWSVPVIITHVMLGQVSAANGDWELLSLAPDDAALGAGAGQWAQNQQQGTWTDQKSLTTDLVPLFGRSAAVKVAGVTPTNTFQKRIHVWQLPNGPASGVDTQMPMRQLGRFGLHAPANGALLWRAVAAFTPAFTTRFAAWGEMA